MKKYKILIIENEVDLAKSTSDFLELNDFETCYFHCGQAAIEYLLHDTPDLIISDLMMPGMDGFEVLETVRKIQHLEEIPFLFLTGMTEEDYRRTGMIKGADDFISKPFKFDQLLASINSALNRNQKRKEEIQGLSREIEEQLDSLNKVNHLTNHMVRANLANIMLTLQLLKEGELSAEEALSILHEASANIDNNTMDINSILNCNHHKVDHKTPLTFNYDRVMLVDDDPTQLMLNKMVVKKVLGSKSIVTFTEGMLAMEHLATNKIDVIFLDLNMPNMNGMDVLNAIKTTRLNIPVIMLSSSLDPVQINDCYKFDNVAQYLVKPLQPERLKRVVA